MVEMKRAGHPAKTPVLAEAPSSADDDMMMPADVAALFDVTPKTVTRWARSGKLVAVKTLGGHRRYRRSEVERARREFVKDD